MPFPWVVGDRSIKARAQVLDISQDLPSGDLEPIDDVLSGDTSPLFNRSGNKDDSFSLAHCLRTALKIEGRELG